MDLTKAKGLFTLLPQLVHQAPTVFVEGPNHNHVLVQSAQDCENCALVAGSRGVKPALKLTYFFLPRIRRKLTYFFLPRIRRSRRSCL